MGGSGGVVVCVCVCVSGVVLADGGHWGVGGILLWGFLIFLSLLGPLLRQGDTRVVLAGEGVVRGEGFEGGGV